MSLAHVGRTLLSAAVDLGFEFELLVKTDTGKSKSKTADKSVRPTPA